MTVKKFHVYFEGYTIMKYEPTKRLPMHILTMIYLSLCLLCLLFT
uniref:Uncharacterized protein n=1 Tax=Arundo donax TaxID=35708 RepID=A0A0A9EQI4_ARUDO